MPLIRITKAGEVFQVRFQYHWSLVDAMKEAGGKWHAEDKYWAFLDKDAVAVLDRANLGATDPDDFFYRVQQGMLAASKRIEMVGDASKIGSMIPDSLKLRDYQIEGVKWIAEHESTLLADEMGTGKTIQVAAAFNCCPQMKRALIICPASLKINWYRELRGDAETKKVGWLTNKELTVGIAKGLYWPNCNIVIINYDILARHKKKIDSIDWDFCVVDECHYLKNLNAGRTAAVVGRKSRKGKDNKEVGGFSPIHAQRKIAMSGTPLVNKPSELFAMLNWLDPKRWPSFFWFAKKFCGATKGRFGYTYDGATNLEELNSRLRRTVMIRRTKREVMKELPPKLRQVIEFEAPEITEKVREENLFANKLQQRLAVVRAAVELAKINQDEAEYRKAVDALRGELLAGMDHIASLRQQLAVAKIPYVLEHARLSLMDGRKLVIFAHHRDVIWGLKSGLAKDFQCRHIIGGMDSIERQAAIDAFQNNPDVKVIVCSIMAAGVGLTLTAGHHVLFAEMDWVPGNITQAEDRCHRMGQLEPVLIQHLVAYGSLDARIAKRVIEKQQILDTVLDGSFDVAYEPVDWLDEMKPTIVSEPLVEKILPKIDPYKRACALYACKKMVREIPHGMSPVDMILLTRFAVLPELNDRQTVFVASVAQRYLGGWDWLKEAKENLQKELDKDPGPVLFS